MESIFLARQPIFDIDLNVIAYEMLYRDLSKKNHVDSDMATSDVLLNLFSEIGHETAAASKPAFINLTNSFLAGDLTISFPGDMLVIELQKNISSDLTLIDHIKKLNQSGYKFALADFSYSESWLPLLEVADYIKIDVSKISETDLKQTLNKMADFSVKLIAEKIETKEMFNQCIELGFDYFQGFFLCQPNISEGQQSPANKMVVLNLLAKLQDDAVSIDELSQLLIQDATLTIKILHILNSSLYTFSREITSINEAIIMLGRSQITNIANLILLNKLSEKPPELMIIGMQRAKQCEQLALKMQVENPTAYFTAGLLSVVDAILDQDIKDIISEIPLSPEIKTALSAKKGSLGKILQAVIEYENGDWSALNILELKQYDFQEAYVHAIQWTSDTCHFI